MTSAFVSEQIWFARDARAVAKGKRITEQCKQDHKWFEVENPCTDGSQRAVAFRLQQKSGVGQLERRQRVVERHQVHCALQVRPRLPDPALQIVLLLDQSSGHTKCAARRFAACTDLNFRDGGNQKDNHDTTCLKEDEDIGVFLASTLAAAAVATTTATAMAAVAVATTMMTTAETAMAGPTHLQQHQKMSTACHRHRRRQQPQVQHHRRNARRACCSTTRSTTQPRTTQLGTTMGPDLQEELGRAQQCSW
jgi:hypothetical protein